MQQPTQPTRIHSGKNPPRRHFIREWAAKRHLRQADIAREIEVDKSVVSRWFRKNDPTMPTDEHLDKLAALFATDRQGLFRDPNDDWLAHFFREQGIPDEEVTEEKRHQARVVMITLFQKKAG